MRRPAHANPLLWGFLLGHVCALPVLAVVTIVFAGQASPFARMLFLAWLLVSFLLVTACMYMIRSNKPS